MATYLFFEPANLLAGQTGPDEQRVDLDENQREKFLKVFANVAAM
jgi:hypothetical protein